MLRCLPGLEFPHSLSSFFPCISFIYLFVYLFGIISSSEHVSLSSGSQLSLEATDLPSHRNPGTKSSYSLNLEASDFILYFRSVE